VIEFEAEIGPMRPKGALTFDQTDEGTKVTFRGDSIPVRPVQVPLSSPQPQGPAGLESEIGADHDRPRGLGSLGHGTGGEGNTVRP
jgi:hypothetical protein